ncbi:helix-turn-helix domain-containing protein [Achromobacter mucicolens]|nr:helix-turn-helix domain-containing protein [Achromobacter mucicolens]WBX88832.1 helix-turn-helix domain-containing protein [Achromobacter mucicolens]
MSATPMRSLAHSSRCADRSADGSPVRNAALHLSDRQAACLKWSAAGKTSWETSRILGVSESTVNFHLRNACNRLGVRGRRAAVVAALRLGLLEFKA